MLEEDLTLVGPLTAALRVSTTGTDADFVVKLIDVYSGDHPGVGPESGVVMGGYQQLVRGEPMRYAFAALPWDHCRAVPRIACTYSMLIACAPFSFASEANSAIRLNFRSHSCLVK